MIRAVKVPRLVAAGVAAGALLASCVHPPGPASGANAVAAPDLSSPLVEEYPAPQEPRDPLKMTLFARINRDRVAHGLPPVAWDEKASGVADTFCAQQVSEGSQGHFLMDGVPPYARMGFAGAFGFFLENSASSTTTGHWAKRAYVDLAISSHERMLAERPPNDGHRRAILDGNATHVGVGYSGGGGRFQMAEEFSVRRLERLAVSRSADGTAVVAFDGRVRSPDRLQFVTIATEPVPASLTLQEAKSRRRYRYPSPSESYVPEGTSRLIVSGTVTHDRLHLHRDRRFTFAYAPERPGLFTFVFYVAREDGESPREAGSAAVLFQ